MATTGRARSASQAFQRARSSVCEDAKPTVKKGSIAPFICAVCGQGFTRKTTVKEPHFASCVKKNGNPDGVAWDGDPSCFTKRSDGSMGPSGTVPKGVNAALRANEAAQQNSIDSVSEDDESVYYTSAKTRKEALQKAETLDSEDAEGSYMEHLTGASSANEPSISSPASHEQSTRSQTPYFDSSSPFPRLPVRRSKPALTPPTGSISKPMLSGMMMNKLANVAISASRAKAGMNYQEANKMFKIWRNLMPDEATSNVVAPNPFSDQKHRQQAVVWLAQDVYGACLPKLRSVDDQLQMIRLWRDLVVFLHDWQARTRMQKLLADAWGEDGPELLGEMESSNWKYFNI